MRAASNVKTSAIYRVQQKCLTNAPLTDELLFHRSAAVLLLYLLVAIHFQKIKKCTDQTWRGKSASLCRVYFHTNEPQLTAKERSRACGLWKTTSSQSGQKACFKSPTLPFLYVIVTLLLHNPNTSGCISEINNFWRVWLHTCNWRKLHSRPQLDHSD